MQARDFEASISYLKQAFPEPWNSVIERACQENLQQNPQPKRSKFMAYSKLHKYGPCEIKICEGKFKEIVFAAMLKDAACSAPTLSHTAIYTGKTEALLPFQDKIVRLVNDTEFVIYNVTLPEHILFPGFVKLAVCENDTNTFVTVSGEGIGNWARFNTFLGPPLFRRILTKRLIPAVQKSL